MNSGDGAIDMSALNNKLSAGDGNTQKTKPTGADKLTIAELEALSAKITRDENGCWIRKAGASLLNGSTSKHVPEQQPALYTAWKPVAWWIKRLKEYKHENAYIRLSDVVEALPNSSGSGQHDAPMPSEGVSEDTMAGHNHTPWPEYEAKLLSFGTDSKLVYDVMEGLRTSDITKNCPGCKEGGANPEPTTNEFCLKVSTHGVSSSLTNGGVMKETELEAKLREILLGLDLGYTYRMSDYATSQEQEAEYEREGLEQVDQAIKEILNLFRGVE